MLLKINTMIINEILEERIAGENDLTGKINLNLHKEFQSIQSLVV